MPVSITNEKEFAAIAADGEYELACDIDMPADWVSLRGIRSVVLHGGGYSVRGLKTPLFGSVAFLKVDNLRIECDIHEPAGRYTGAICRYGLQVKLSGCSVAGYVLGGEYVGSLAGDVSQSSITECRNSAEIGGNAYVGGLVGISSHSSVTCSVNKGLIRPVGPSMYGGGIIGCAIDESFIADNVNEGIIADYSFNCCGGIAGGLADIRVFQGNINKGFVNGGRCAGGIAGVADASAMQSNESIMPVSASGDYAGGIVGLAYHGPGLISANICAGAVETTGACAGGVAGCAAGCVIADNIVSCPSVRGGAYTARVLGKAAGQVYLRNTKVFANMLISGGSYMGQPYADQIMFPDDADNGADKLMGASYVAPDGYKVSGIRMQLDPIVETDDASDDSASDGPPLGESLRQVAASLNLGVSALARIFQADNDAVINMLRREKEAIRSLRATRAALDAYCDYIDQSEAAADGAGGADNETVGEAVPRVTILCVSKRTGQPLSGVTLHISGADGDGYNQYITSDAEGRVIMDGAQYGEYDIIEYTAPYLYLRDKTPRRLVLSPDGAATLNGVAAAGAGNGMCIFKITFERDESQLFIQGQNWAARPEARQMGLNPYSPAYNRHEPEPTEELYAREGTE